LSDLDAVGVARPVFSGALILSDFTAGAIISAGAFCCAAGAPEGSFVFIPCAETAPAPSSNIATVVDISRTVLMDVSFETPQLSNFVDVWADSVGRSQLFLTVDGGQF
jgi:hypothetical protein